MAAKDTSPRAGRKATPARREAQSDVEAQIHRRTRSAHRDERSQDYVEAIAALIASCGEARAIDIARKMGVTHVTAGKIISRLQREGLVTREPYRSIFLTEKGRKVAEEARRRHEVVLDFLVAIGVGPGVAATDAEGIEHHVSEETLEAMTKFIKSRRARV